jgi:hypothetical protein
LGFDGVRPKILRIVKRGQVVRINDIHSSRAAKPSGCAASRLIAASKRISLHPFRHHQRPPSRVLIRPGSYPAGMRAASPDIAYRQTTSEMMEARVVVETVDATILSSIDLAPNSAGTPFFAWCDILPKKIT